MAIPVVIQGSTFQLNVQSDSPPWGSDLSDLLNALVNAVNSTTGSSDILLTNFTITNNTASPTNVTGAAFNVSLVRSFSMPYSIYITTNSNELSETGTLLGTYSTVAGTWEMGQTFVGNSGVKFSITNGGQIQYTSTNVSGSSYTSKLKFKASCFLQT